MNIGGSNNIIVFCSFFENHDTGLQLGNGAANNQIINCDSHFNEDLGQGNADGFASKLTVGSGNYFYGCMAWQNSDDGWDGYMRGANDVKSINIKSLQLKNFKLAQKYPNPFNPNTKFRYEVVTPGLFTFTIYNVMGKQVASLVDDYKYLGYYEINWNAKDSEGNSFPSGIYIAKLKSGS